MAAHTKQQIDSRSLAEVSAIRRVRRTNQSALTGHHRWLSRLLNALSLAIIVLFSSAAQIAYCEPPFDGFDDYVDNLMKSMSIPGMAIAVVKDDRIAFSKGYGVRALGSTESVDENTIFAIGSITKSFTSTLIAMLVEEKKMSWSGRVTEYLKGFELADSYVTRAVNVSDLLSHRTGLPETDFIWYGSPFNRSEILKRIRFQQATHGFRESYEYQNVMYLAAGEAAASASGTSWDESIKQRIFAPLQMTSSSTSTNDLGGFTNVAQPHSIVGGKLAMIPYRNMDNIAPAGAINSSVRDMAQYLRLLLNQGKFDGKQLLSSNSLDDLWTPMIRVPCPAARLKTDRSHYDFASYGRGWLVQSFSGHRAIWHTGGIDGMRSFIGLLPEQNFGLIILCNSDAEDQSADIGLGFKIMDKCLHLPDKDWCAEILKLRHEQLAEGRKDEAERKAERFAGTSPSLELTKYEGTYRNPVYGEMVIKLDNGKLTLAFGPHRFAYLNHWHYDTFKTDWQGFGYVNSYITFSTDSTGASRRLDYQNLATFER